MVRSMVDLLRSVIGRVDGENRMIANLVTERLARYPENYRLTVREGRTIMRDVQSIVASRYGRDRASAVRSPIFRAITEHTDLAADKAFNDTFSVLQRSMERVDPDRWDAVRQNLYMQGVDEPGSMAEAYMSLNGPQAQRQQFLRSSVFDPQRRWVNGDSYRLSDRVWMAGKRQRKAIDKTIQQAIRSGTGPQTLAGQLNRYLNPDFAPVKYDANGRMVRRNNNRSGATSARVLARTELNRVHHDATKDAVARLEIHRVGVKWNLSAAHPKIDVCDSLAKGASRGFPPGVYDPDEVPGFPHPQCICFLTPYVPSSEEVLKELEDRYTGRLGEAAAMRPIERLKPEEIDQITDMQPQIFGPSPWWSQDPYATKVARDYKDYWNYRMNWALKQEFEDRWAKAGYILDIKDDVAWPPSMWNWGGLEVMDAEDLAWALNNLADAVNYRASLGRWVPTHWDVWASGSRGRDEVVAWVNYYDNTDLVNINIRNSTWVLEDAFIIEDDGGWSAVNSAYGTVNHEIGHLLHNDVYAAGGDWDRRNFRWKDRDGFWRENNDASWLGDAETDIAAQVSSYALTSPEEFVAEVYALLTTGDPEGWLDDEVMELYWILFGPDIDGNPYVP